MEAAEYSARASEGVGDVTRVAVVGGSEHAAAVVRLLARVPSVSVVSVCAAPDQPAGALAQRAGIPLISEPADVLAALSPPDVLIDLSEDVVTRAALEHSLPPSTELLGGSAVDLLGDVLKKLNGTAGRSAEGDAVGTTRRLEASNAALVRANLDLEARLAEVYFMHEFVKALVAHRRVEDVSSVVVDACVGILGADVAAVYLLDRERWVLRLAQGQGRPVDAMAAEVGLTDPLLGRAFSDGRAIEAHAAPGTYSASWIAAGAGRVSTQAAVSLLAGGEPIGVLAVGWSMARSLETPEVERLQVMADQSALSLQNALLHAELEQMSVTDRLTELFNHGYVTQRLEQELGRATRFGHSLSVIMLDIDDFKAFNDRFGHLVGDDVLRAVSLLIRQNMREMDVAARYGGEEFLVLVPETGSEGARSVAERIRAGVADRVFHRDEAGAPIHATVSIGVSTFPAAGSTVESLIKAADEAMYRAKRAGKNRVVVSGPEHAVEPAEGV